MEKILVQREVERIVNLVVGFGWSKTTETLVDDKLSITFTKQITSKPDYP